MREHEPFKAIPVAEHQKRQVEDFYKPTEQRISEVGFRAYSRFHPMADTLDVIGTFWVVE